MIRESFADAVANRVSQRKQFSAKRILFSLVFAAVYLVVYLIAAAQLNGWIAVFFYAAAGFQAIILIMLLVGMSVLSSRSMGAKTGP